MVTVESIFNKLSYSAEVLGKSTETSGSHLRVTIERNNNDKTLVFEFHANMYSDGDLETYIECLFTDRAAYLFSQNARDFAESFGYEVDSDKALSIYKACKENSTKLSKFFTKRELEVLERWVADQI